jgi:hypothetical protein
MRLQASIPLGSKSIVKIAPREVGVNFQEFDITNDNAGVAAVAIADGVEEPAASQDDVAVLECIADLSERNGSAEEQE